MVAIIKGIQEIIMEDITTVQIITTANAGIIIVTVMGTIRLATTTEIIKVSETSVMKTTLIAKGNVINNPKEVPRSQVLKQIDLTKRPLVAMPSALGRAIDSLNATENNLSRVPTIVENLLQDVLGLITETPISNLEITEITPLNVRKNNHSKEMQNAQTIIKTGPNDVEETKNRLTKEIKVHKKTKVPVSMGTFFVRNGQESSTFYQKTLLLPSSLNQRSYPFLFSQILLVI